MLIRAVAIVVAVASVLVAVTFATGLVQPPAVRPGVPDGFVPAGVPLPEFQSDLTSDPADLDSYIPAVAPPGGVFVRNGVIRVPAPAPPNGPRRVAIQVGHWQTESAPPELYRLIAQPGATWSGVREVDVNLDIARRVAARLERQGIAVDLLPATIPPGYVADAFLALHADSDGVGELSGFKAAHGPKRGPFEDALVADLQRTYGILTGLDWDAEHISPNMRFYYAFNWGRYQHALAPHTPAAILEMGYVSNDDDRGKMLEHADVLADAIVAGLTAFLAETPRERIFAADLEFPVLPPSTPPPSPSP